MPSQVHLAVFTRWRTHCHDTSDLDAKVVPVYRACSNKGFVFEHERAVRCDAKGEKGTASGHDGVERTGRWMTQGRGQRLEVRGFVSAGPVLEEFSVGTALDRARAGVMQALWQGSHDDWSQARTLSTWRSSFVIPPDLPANFCRWCGSTFVVQALDSAQPAVVPSDGLSPPPSPPILQPLPTSTFLNPPRSSVLFLFPFRSFSFLFFFPSSSRPDRGFCFSYPPRASLLAVSHYILLLPQVPTATPP